MTETINLKELEKKAYRDSQQDGLMELMMGLILMAFGGFFYSTVFVFYFIGGFLVLSGLVIFIRFLRKYPLPEKEVSGVV